MKKTSLSCLICAVLSAFVLLVPFINGMGCNYELTLKWNNTHYDGVCRWGVLHMVETDIETRARWVIEARQLSFMNQIVYLVKKREQVNSGTGVSDLNIYNQQQSGFTVFNYAWISLSEDEIVIFQDTPHHQVYIAKIEGPFDTADRILSKKKMYTWK